MAVYNTAYDMSLIHILNKERVMVSEFNELIKPQVYHEMHKITSKPVSYTHLDVYKRQPTDRAISDTGNAVWES